MRRHRASSPDDSQQGRVRRQFEQALEAEEATGRVLAMGAILAGLAVVAIWLFVQVEPPSVWYYQAIIGVLVALTLGNYALARSRFDAFWRPYVFVTLCFALLTFAIIVPNPFVDGGWPPQMYLRLGNFGYALLFLAPVALSFRPSLMIWAGVSAALAWAVGVAWVLRQRDTTTWQSAFPSGAPDDPLAALRAYLDPHFVDLGARVQDALVALLLAGVLALVTWRSRRLVLKQIAAARERANLARYFAPTVVEELARLDEPLGATRQQPVAVMFADIVGFTELASVSSPERVIATLRAFHERLEHAIFDHGGTLDKFLGDGVMATLARPQPARVTRSRHSAAR